MKLNSFDIALSSLFVAVFAMILVVLVFWVEEPGDIHPAVEKSPPVQLGEGMVLEPAWANFHQNEVRNGLRVTFYSLRHVESTDEYEVTIFSGKVGEPRCKSIHDPVLSRRFPSRDAALAAIREQWRRNRELGADRLAGWGSVPQDSDAGEVVQ